MEENQVKQDDKGKVPKFYEIEEKEVQTLNEMDMSGTYTYASYLQWQFQERVELIKGKIFPMSAPTTKHQVCTGNVFVKLHQFLKRSPCRAFISPFDVRFPGKSLADREVFTVL